MVKGERRNCVTVCNAMLCYTCVSLGWFALLWFGVVTKMKDGTQYQNRTRIKGGRMRRNQDLHMNDQNCSGCEEEGRRTEKGLRRRRREGKESPGFEK